MTAHFLPAMSLPATQNEYRRSMTHLIWDGMEYQYTGAVNTTPSASRIAGAISLKSSSKEHALPVLKHVSQARQPPSFLKAASKRVTACPFASAAEMNASVIAKLLPSLRGLPVMTTMLAMSGPLSIASAFVERRIYTSSLPAFQAPPTSSPTTR